MLSQLDAANYGHQDLENTVCQLKRRTSGYAVPPWSLPKDLWRLLLTGSWRYGDHSVPASACYLSLLERLFVLMRFTGRIPLEWALSLGCPIPKHNGTPEAFASFTYWTHCPRLGILEFGVSDLFHSAQLRLAVYEGIDEKRPYCCSGLCSTVSARQV